MRLTFVLLAAALLAGCGGASQPQPEWTVRSEPVQTRLPYVPHVNHFTPPSPSPKPSPARTQERASRSRLIDGAEAWASSWAARAVARCESDGNPRAVSATGKYRGKWQMDADFWRTYGGLRYASRPELASESAQDAVAYRGWLARGWQPWECRKVL